MNFVVVGQIVHSYIFNYPLGLHGILDFSNMQFLSEVTAYLVKNVNLKFDLNELIWYIDRTSTLLKQWINKL